MCKIINPTQILFERDLNRTNTLSNVINITVKFKIENDLTEELYLRYQKRIVKNVDKMINRDFIKLAVNEKILIIHNYPNKLTRDNISFNYSVNLTFKPIEINKKKLKKIINEIIKEYNNKYIY